MTRRHAAGGPSADALAAAFPAMWEHLSTTLDGGRTRREPAVFLAVTGSPAASLNGLWILGRGVRRATVERLLGELADTGLPFCLQVRPGMDRAARAAAERRGMTPDEDAALMVATSPPAARVPAELTLRRLAAEETAVHIRVAAAGFEAPVAVFEPLITAQMLRTHGVAVYVGEVEGEAVVTGLGVILGAGVAIANVATLPGHRRRGYGAGLTARACADGLAAGAGYAWLQATGMAERVYEGLGFRTVERWRRWVEEPS